MRGLHTPLGNVNIFNPKPSPELAGVIAVVLSDGSLCLHSNYVYKMRLEVKDRKYAKAFGTDLAKVLGKRRPYRPHWIKSHKCWFVEGGSILLYNHLDKPWQELKADIEHSEVCLTRFLRMFFDGEGSVSGRALTISNTDSELLLYIQQLLRRYFGIETTGPHRSTKAGRRFRDPRNGKTYRTRKTCHKLYIRANGLPKFHRYIGFTIERKQRRLIEAIQE